jgi:hypothetical protein
MRYVLAVLTLLIYGCDPVFAASGADVRNYFLKAFAGAVSMASDETNYESSKVIVGFPKYYITQDISQVAVAEREGRVFVNPDIFALPDGDYTFILTEEGDLEFGLIENDIEIGVKHFQLAKGRALFAAGEFTKHDGKMRLSIKSGTFSRHLKRMAGYSESKTMHRIEKAFRKLWGVEIEMEFETLYADPEEIEIGILLKYCLHPEFFRFHESTICAYYKNLIEAECIRKLTQD